MQWLWANKEWLFSGIGASALFVIAGLIFQAVRRNAAVTTTPPETPIATTVVAPSTSQPPPTAQPESKEVSSELTYADIESAFRDNPVIEQQNISDRFTGIKIEWDAYLRNMLPAHDGSIRLYLRAPKDPLHHFDVACNVMLADYPRLKILKTGAPIRITGYISEAQSFGIEVRDAKLDF